MKNLAIWLVIATGCVVSSLHVAVAIHGTDFPVYYSAATLLKEGKSVEDVYVKSMEGLDILPERYPLNCYFIYSPIIAWLMSPLAYLAYYDAKTLLLLINVAAYVLAILLLLKLIRQVSWPAFISAILFMWMPFFTTFAVSQVNAILLLLIAASACFSIGNKPWGAGFLLGFAALFKIFPLVVAALLGKVQPKIAAAGMVCFITALLFPGSRRWLEAIHTVSAGHTPVFILLEQHGIAIFAIFSLGILLLSITVIVYSGTEDPLTLIAYALPATFAAMPVVQYHHLTLLSVTYIVFLLSDLHSCNKSYLACPLYFTIIHINLSPFIEKLPNPYWSVLLLWAFLSVLLVVPLNRPSQLKTVGQNAESPRQST